jgi:hypothetical protein
MRKLINTSVAPPEFFSYTHQETGHTTVANDYITWVQRAKEHRSANNLSIPDDFEFLMQDQLCGKIPPELCEYGVNDPQWVNVRLTWADVMSASKIYLEWRRQGKPFVSQEEAERRAKICAGCYLNVRVAGCGGLCREVAQLVTDSKGERKTEYDSKLLNCAVCKCSNAAQIHFPLTLLELSDTDARQQQYPSSFCWKSKASPEYLPNP